jgi:oligosaccharide repeat unit polymerase
MYEIALIFSVACFCGVGLYYLRSPQFSVFHPLTIYMLFHGLVFVIRPILSTILDYEQIYRAYQFTPSPADKLTVILASNLGFLAFALAALRFGSPAMRFKQNQMFQRERDRIRPSFLWVLAICSPIAIYSLIKVWTGAATYGEGFEGMARDAGTGVYINTTSNGYVAEAQLMLATCSALLAWLFRFHLLALMPLVLFALFRAGTGGRGPFITALVTLGLLYLYENRRRFPSLRVLVLLACLLPIFTAVGDDRGASIRRAIGTEASSEIFGLRRSDEKFMEGMDFGNLEYFEYLVYAIPQRTGTYGYFVDTLQLFTEPVPRALWRDKPVGAPFNKIYLFDYGNPVGLTRSLPGQGWYSLGWLGVVIWCGFWGWALGLLYRRFVEGAQGSFQVLAYMTFLPILIVAFRDGQIITIFRQGLFFLAPIVLWWWLARGVGVAPIARRRPDPLENPASSNPAPEALPEFALDDIVIPAAVRRRRIALQKDRPSAPRESSG